MKSRYFLNILLMIVVLGLYWFLNQDTSIPTKPILSITSHDDISQITIDRNGLDTISIHKNSSGWQLVQPLNAPANNMRMKLLLSILNSPIYAQLSHADNATRSQLGFNDTSTVLTLNNDRFQFGHIEPISKRRYVLHNDVIHLINDNVAPLLNANAASFIDNKLIPLNKQISKLIITKSNTDNNLSTDDIIIEQKQGQWISNGNLSTDQLSLLIEAWQHAYALQVIPLKTAKQPLTEPHKITVWFNDASIELELKTDARTLYISNQQQQLNYQFPIELLTQLLPIKP